MGTQEIVKQWKGKVTPGENLTGEEPKQQNSDCLKRTEFTYHTNFSTCFATLKLKHEKVTPAATQSWLKFTAHSH